MGKNELGCRGYIFLDTYFMEKQPRTNEVGMFVDKLFSLFDSRTTKEMMRIVAIGMVFMAGCAAQPTPTEAIVVPPPYAEFIEADKDHCVIFGPGGSISMALFGSVEGGGMGGRSDQTNWPDGSPIEVQLKREPKENWLGEPDARFKVADWEHVELLPQVSDQLCLLVPGEPTPTPEYKPSIKSFLKSDDDGCVEILSGGSVSEAIFGEMGAKVGETTWENGKPIQFYLEKNPNSGSERDISWFILDQLIQVQEDPKMFDVNPGDWVCVVPEN